MYFERALAKLVADRPKSFILFELIQNAWDEATTKVEVRVSRPQTGVCQIIVTDDSPEGFQDLTHAYTLFAESKKKNDPTKRGRFNLGEKLVIALAIEATIITTKGRVQFTKDGRTQDNVIWREAGTEFIGTFRMTVKEKEQMLKDADMLIPPRGVETRINGAIVGGPGFSRSAIAQCNATLPTVHADEEGNLRPTRRQTSVTFHDATDETPMLYELGIPVVEIDCGYHVNVHQKVPLNKDRDNVTPAYLREIQTVTLNWLANADMIKGDDATKGWINDALASTDVKVEAVQAIIKERYGDKVVIFDPSDREGTDMAVAAGYTVLPPRTFTLAAWTNVKAAGVLPAGRVTPSPKVYVEHGRLEESDLFRKLMWLPEVRVLDVMRTVSYLDLAIRRPF